MCVGLYVDVFYLNGLIVDVCGCVVEVGDFYCKVLYLCFMYYEVLMYFVMLFDVGGDCVGV